MACEEGLRELCKENAGQKRAELQLRKAVRTRSLTVTGRKKEDV